MSSSEKYSRRTNHGVQLGLTAATSTSPATGASVLHWNRQELDMMNIVTMMADGGEDSLSSFGVEDHDDHDG